MNVLWRLLTGEKFDYESEKLQSLVNRLTLMFQRYGRPSAFLNVAFPWISKIYPKSLNRHESVNVSHDILDLMRQKVEEHKETLDIDDPRDVIDKVLIEINNTTDTNSSYFGEKGKQNLVNTLFDFFIAAHETTSSTMAWAILYMARYSMLAV